MNFINFPRCILRTLFNSTFYICLLISLLNAPGAFALWTDTGSYNFYTSVDADYYYDNGMVLNRLSDSNQWAGQDALNVAYSIDPDGFEALYNFASSNDPELVLPPGYVAPGGGGGGGGAWDPLAAIPGYDQTISSFALWISIAGIGFLLAVLGVVINRTRGKGRG